MSEPGIRSDVLDLSGAIGQKISIPHQVREALRELIISGRLNPGDRIVESRLARQLAVGHPTVREALIALEHQGLVVRRPNQGCSVTRLSREEIAQISRVRLHLEVLAAELAAENVAGSRSSELLSIADDMKAAGDAGRVEDFYRHDLRFHETLWRLTNNPFLEKALAHMIVPLLAFGMLDSMREDAEIDLPEAAENHRKIAQAILSGDKEPAKQVTRDLLQIFSTQHLRRAND